MKPEEYIETKIITTKDKSFLVNIGLDDCGQQYFFEYLDNNNKIKEVGCGAYNLFYLDEIKEYFNSYLIEDRLCGEECPLYDSEFSCCSRHNKNTKVELNQKCIYELKRRIKNGECIIR